MITSNRPIAAAICHADTSYGWGHKMRCEALAEQFRAYGVPTNLLLFAYDTVEPWSKEHDSYYRIVVFDDPNVAYINITSFARIVGASLTAVFIDTDIPTNAIDIAINGNVYAWDVDTTHLRAGMRLFGPEYLCIRKSITDLRHQRNYSCASISPRVLVTLGGNPPDGLREAIIDAWKRTNPPADAVIDAPYPGNNLAPYLHVADLAICSGGSTLYELACLGIPAISLPQTDDEVLNVLHLERRGACLALPRDRDLALMQLPATLRLLTGSPERRHAMSKVGRLLVDGRGAERVVNEIIKKVNNDN